MKLKFGGGSYSSLKVARFLRIAPTTKALKDRWFLQKKMYLGCFLVAQILQACLILQNVLWGNDGPFFHFQVSHCDLRKY